MMPKPLTVWITTNYGKFWKTWEYQTTDLPPEKSYAGQEETVRKKKETELDMEQQTGSKLGKEHVKAVYCQFSSVTQLCPTLCDPMNRSTPGHLVQHQLLEPTQTHVHWVGDAIQPSHPLSSRSALSLSQHPGLFKCVSSLYQVAKVLEFQLQHQSFQWTTRTDLL